MFSLKKHPFQIVLRFLSLVTVLLLVSVLFASQPIATAAPTATFNVNVSFDGADVNVGDGNCAINANLGGRVPYAPPSKKPTPRPGQIPFTSPLVFISSPLAAQILPFHLMPLLGI